MTTEQLQERLGRAIANLHTKAARAIEYEDSLLNQARATAMTEAADSLSAWLDQGGDGFDLAACQEFVEGLRQLAKVATDSARGNPAHEALEGRRRGRWYGLFTIAAAMGLPPLAGDKWGGRRPNCLGHRKDGLPCRRPGRAESGYCSLHEGQCAPGATDSTA